MTGPIVFDHVKGVVTMPTCDFCRVAPAVAIISASGKPPKGYDDVCRACYDEWRDA